MYWGAPDNGSETLYIYRLLYASRNEKKEKKKEKNNLKKRSKEF